jgi:uncharacterized membrane protein YfcA
MNTPDLINGSFECIGGILCWLNFLTLLKDKQVKGVSLLVCFFFSIWGFWNLYFYPCLHQMFSFFGAGFLALGNSSWLILAIYYKRKNKISH